MASLVKDKVINESVFKPFRDYYGMYAEILKLYFLTRHYYAGAFLINVGEDYNGKFPFKLGCVRECMQTL